MATKLWQKIGIGIGVVAVSVALVGAGWYGASAGWLATDTATTTKIGNGIHQGPQDGTGQQHGVNGTQPHLQQGDQAAQPQQQGQHRGNGRGRMTHSEDQ